MGPADVRKVRPQALKSITRKPRRGALKPEVEGKGERAKAISDGWGDDIEMFWEVLRFVGLRPFAEETEARIKQAIEKRQA
jgi:hypothetical protein